MKSTRLKGIRGSNFEVDLEYNDQLIFIHLPQLEKFTRGTLIEWKYLLEDWYPFFKTMGYQTLFAAVDPESRISKVLVLLNFELLAIENGLAIYALKEE